jgi:NAD(P)-dependent dehydrogenase (short-subunit alcohol dehydrogenase family)
VSSHVDVLAHDSVRCSVGEAMSHLGRLDVVVNSGGKTSTDRDDDFERNVDMFLLGTWRDAREHPVPLAERRRVIDNIASIAGITGSIGPTGYGPTKHDVVGATEDAALKYAKDRIRVNVVCPRYVETPMTAPNRATDAESEYLITQTPRVPLGRWGQAGERVLDLVGPVSRGWRGS